MKPCLTGSSPLIRGKRGPNHSIGAQSGLIPAHAGKTSRSECLGRRAGAHPRSCGEYRTDDCHKITKRGSSPLTRENAWAEHPNTSRVGSSPLTRGKRYRDVRGWLQGRLIPAHVGKTMTAPPVAIHRRAHPRSRGENTGWLSEGGHHYGSSRSRGENSALTHSTRLTSGASPLTRGNPD